MLRTSTLYLFWNSFQGGYGDGHSSMDAGKRNISALIPSCRQKHLTLGSSLICSEAYYVEFYQLCVTHVNSDTVNLRSCLDRPRWNPFRPPIQVHHSVKPGSRSGRMPFRGLQDH